ncbi:hypothetical protein K503DRAFT_446230 [Rhizopogon vinicolor AM-OR11-026]|uniref:Uncharacterized protein n=1 Tax=Rhizopogon vinicolor AM-OR11-026 TaxID=1314800 RepID=A0A1B7MP74_9AGAM|nr:hypothetical protein K503DRAFT_446230 [Rhizopogon vinicolor AM-OR11-026]
MSIPVRQGEQAIYCHGVAPDHLLRQGQRYSGTYKGVCLPLEVQNVRPNERNDHFKEVPIKSHVSKARVISVWLMNTTPSTTSEYTEWGLKGLELCVALLFYSKSEATQIRYHPYFPTYVGQFWAARSPKEFSLLSAGFQDTQKDFERSSVTHTIHPQKLVIRQEGAPWVLRDGNLEGQSYFAISFRWGDVFRKTDHESVQESKKRHFYHYIEETVGKSEEEARRPKGMASPFRWGSSQPAYWVDLRCSTQGSPENAEGAPGANVWVPSTGGAHADQGAGAEGYPADMYRMADIYRNAKFTLILLPDVPGDKRSIAKRWKDWGSRMWTFPEACLSRELWYRVGNGPLTRISLQELAKLAFTRPEDEAALVNAYDLHKDPLDRLARLDHLKKAIWRRYHSGHGTEQAGESENHADSVRSVVPKESDDPDSCDCREHGVVVRSQAQNARADTAARVYALMGFFEHRILPVEGESEMQALARLSMKNDSDRIAERMVSMLPKCMSESWYVDEDAYGAHSWDIATDIQIAGITQSGALVLEGCRAVTIHWKDFPRLKYSTASPPARVVFYRSFGLFFAPTFFMTGIALVAVHKPIGGLFIFLAIVLAFAILLSYAIDLSQPIKRVEPWLIGVKGVLSAEQVSKQLYGGHTQGFHPTRYTPSGTRFSTADTCSRFRAGDHKQFKVAVEKDPHDDANGDMYTLVDTLSGTIYYFRARRPPTTCLFTGREGGMGRYVLCSESCELNELQKETVLRMPTFISDCMHHSDWVALGCRGDAVSANEKGTPGPTKSIVTEHTAIELSDFPQEKHRSTVL